MRYPYPRDHFGACTKLTRARAGNCWSRGNPPFWMALWEIVLEVLELMVLGPFCLHLWRKMSLKKVSGSVLSERTFCNLVIVQLPSSHAITDPDRRNQTCTRTLYVHMHACMLRILRPRSSMVIFQLQAMFQGLQSTLDLNDCPDYGKKMI